VSLLFFFLFSLPFFFLVVGFFSLLWSSRSRLFCSPPPVAGHLCLSLIATFLSDASSQISSEPLRLIVWHFISLFLLCFSLYFVFVCSSCFWVLIFPCIVLSLFGLCVFYFCSFADLLHVSFIASTYCQALFCAPPPPPQRTSNAPFSGRGLLECDRFFSVFPFCLYLFFPPVFLLCICL
jgi:hypothetical protein